MIFFHAAFSLQIFRNDIGIQNLRSTTLPLSFTLAFHGGIALLLRLGASFLLLWRNLGSFWFLFLFPVLIFFDRPGQAFPRRTLALVRLPLRTRTLRPSRRQPKLLFVRRLCKRISNGMCLVTKTHFSLK